jgi:hypothetical protein
MKWQQEYERLVKCDKTHFNSKIAQVIDAKFMMLAKQNSSPDLPFSDYCINICMMEQRYNVSRHIWRRFKPDRKEAIYQMLVKQLLIKFN